MRKTENYTERPNGRPASCAGRAEREIRVYDMLDSLGVEYHRVDHKAADNIAACAGIDKALNTTLCKNLFLCNRSRTKFYLLMMQRDKKFVTKDISKQIGSSRLCFADQEYMERFLDLFPGSVSIMGLMNDRENNVRLLVDKDVANSEYVGCHPCVNTSSLRLRTADLFKRVLPAMGHDMTIVKVE